MKENKILKWSISLGIIIVLNLFFAYALKIVYEAPVWDDFCKKEQVVDPVNTKKDCLEKGGQWNSNMSREDFFPSDVKTPKGFCNLQFTCHNQFEEARENYERNVFVALIILGVFSIIISFFIAEAEAVSTGLSLGGVLSFVIASIYKP